MQIIFQDKRKRFIRQKEIVSFSLKETGLYVVTISARCKSEKQFGGTDDENLRLEIDGRKFPHPLNPERHADSPTGAKGMYQLTEITVKQIAKLGYKIHDVFNIDQNIAGGQIYFGWLYQQYAGTAEQLERTLAAWNWGLANVPREKSFDWSRLPNETEIFIKNVLGTK